MQKTGTFPGVYVPANVLLDHAVPKCIITSLSENNSLKHKKTCQMFYVGGLIESNKHMGYFKTHSYIASE